MKSSRILISLIVVFLFAVPATVYCQNKVVVIPLMGKCSELKFNSFEVYRSDIIRELNRLADNEEIYYAANQYFSDDLSIIGLNPAFSPASGSFSWPEMTFNIILADSQSYIIQGSHSKINGYSWTYSVNYSGGICESFFKQNDETFDPEMEVFELYRDKVLHWLKIEFTEQIVYNADYQTYSNEVFYSSNYRKWDSDITLRVVSAGHYYFLLEGEHSKIKGFSWTINSNGWMRTLDKIL